jgi:glycosyltransferase involved in cell wall biosynthesis
MYIPYPAIFVLLLLRVVPRSLRPSRIIADAFISLYDTIVTDRRFLQDTGMPARTLRFLEQRALQFADHLVVDTPQNARFLADAFALPATKISAIPLATDELHFRPQPYTPHVGLCRVLFVGTLAPLHGVMTILEATRMLAGRSDIEFRIIGDGQESPVVDAWLKANQVNLKWERRWQSSSQIAEAIVGADVCLGIFGAGEKTQRVCPYKLYAYSAVGRAIITGDTDWARTATSSGGKTPFSLVAVANAHSLTQRIEELADYPELRHALATRARRYYEEELSNRKSLEMIESLFASINATPSAASLAAPSAR